MCLTKSQVDFSPEKVYASNEALHVYTMLQTCPGHSGTHALLGKRATGDVELCYKCCQVDMCNQGPICTGLCQH